MADNTKFVLWLLLLSGSACFGSQLDVQCLKTVQQSVTDPNGILNSSWIFDNETAGFICKFTGVECWHPDEAMIIGFSFCVSVTLVLKANFLKVFIIAQASLGWNCQLTIFQDLSLQTLHGSCPAWHLWTSHIIAFPVKSQLASQIFSNLQQSA
jgi:hypothetical protein